MAKKNPSWGGRFTKKPSLAAQKFSSSVETDKVLYAQDIACLLYTSPSPRDS